MNLNRDSAVVNRLSLKRDLLRQGNDAHKAIRTALIVCGGAMRGVHGAGAVLALHQLGLGEAFDVVVGVSTGACVASYFLAGYEQTLLGTSIYYDECLNGFINFRRWPVVNVLHIERTMRTGRKRWDVDAVVAAHSEFYVAVTSWETGIGELVDVKTAEPDQLTAVTASFAITEAHRRPIIVNGVPYTDGSLSLPLPAATVLELFQPTDVLVLANRSGIPSRRRLLVQQLGLSGLPRALRAGVRNGRGAWTHSLDDLANSTANVGVLWGSPHIGNLTRDGNRLRQGVAEGFRAMSDAFNADLELELL